MKFDRIYQEKRRDLEMEKRTKSIDLIPRKTLFKSRVVCVEYKVDSLSLSTLLNSLSTLSCESRWWKFAFGERWNRQDKNISFLKIWSSLQLTLFSVLLVDDMAWSINESFIKQSLMRNFPKVLHKNFLKNVKKECVVCNS